MSGKAHKWTLKTVRDRSEQEGACWLWARDINVRTGFPQACINGKSGMSVRRFVFTCLMRKELPKGHVVSTTCGNKACVSPRCLVAKTYGEVLSDAYKTGARWITRASQLERTMDRKGHVKLDLTKAREIRASKESSDYWARKCGVNRRTINKVRANQSWPEPQVAVNASVFTWAAAAVMEAA